jgi:hypothetical protein
MFYAPQTLSWSKMRSVQKCLGRFLAKDMVVRGHVSASRRWSSTEVGLKENKISRKYLKRGPGLEYFLVNSTKLIENEGTSVIEEKHPYVSNEALNGSGKKGELLILTNQLQFHCIYRFIIDYSLRRGLWMSNECQ